MLLTSAAASLFAADLQPVPTKDKKVIRRWTLSGDPRGVAIGADGTVYVGLAQPQSVAAIDPATGTITKQVVLDSAEIAATKELVTLRTNADQSRLYIANGSDESALILSLPDLAVLREITMEGERIRDAVPDPKGRYLYLLGRRVHVFDAEGDTELRTLPIEDPMAIATSTSGATLAVFATEDFGTAKATSVTLFDTKTFRVIAREPMQTEKAIESAIFAAGDRSLVAFSRDSLFEKAAISQRGLININRICLPEGSGPQIATLAGSDTLLVYGERRCSASGAFSGSSRGVTPASLYGVNAYALTFDAKTGSLVATDRAGFLTIYHVPRPATSSP
ncbi:MAG TPA: hypothetical protein VGQ36_15200 [Thermoanaerobaculia bacterium]|nr:hypothetical protein [Thermoanaerobaculia bacterium]